MMSDHLWYGVTDFVCSVLMMCAGSYLLTDTAAPRVIRTCYALITAGAFVNLAGLTADYFDYDGIRYGHVWPGELIGDIGVAILMVTRVHLSRRDRRHAARARTRP